MRKIKFRAKILDNGKWVFGVPIPNSYGDRVFFIPLLLTDKIAYPFERLVDWVVEVMPESIGQYTGLKDKYGVEIYEGDIISELSEQGEDWEKHILAEVVWHKAGFYGKEKGYEPEYPITEFAKGEVIGNIYQNKDLLEGLL